MEKTMLRLFPYFVLVAILAAIGIFLFSRGNNSGEKAKYTDGVSQLEMGGVKYTMINDITSEVYVGSQVRSLVSAERGKQVGIVKSMGVFTLAKLFGVLGDADGRFLIDSNGRLYAKAGAEADALREQLKGDAYFPTLRIVDKTHNLQNASELTAEEAEMLRGLAEAEEKITIADKVFVTDYSNRREIFAFTADGLFYKVTMELFLYKDEIYLTTGFTGDKNTAKDQSLTGVKLPAEQQERFAELFRK